MRERKLLKNLIKRLNGRENNTVIIGRIKRALKSIKRQKFSKRLYNTVYNMLERCGYKVNFETLASYLERSQKDFYYENYEIFSVGDYIALAILYKSKEADDELLECCINTLRIIDIFSFEELYSRVSVIDKYLKTCNGCVYRYCDLKTKQKKRAEIDKYAKVKGISTLKAASILACTEINTEHRFLKLLYFMSLYILTAAFFIITLLLLKDEILIPLLLLLPISELSKQICEMIFSHINIDSSLPKLNISKVPDNAKTLVVITTLLFGEEKDSDLYQKLEHYFLSNRDPNVHFGILGDLKDAQSMITSNDEKIITYAKERIEALNKKYGNYFCLFVRRRGYSKGEARFMGWERKRGALIELVRHIKRRPTSITTEISDSIFLHKVKYIVTLDSDTRLHIGTVKHMLGAMLHPNNKIIIKDNRVVKGYAVMQPRMDTSLESASKTPFSVMLCGSGGIDMYSNAQFDVYQGIFKEGIFCGKGIFNVEAFYYLLDNAFPEEAVLSHDLLEGARLNAANLTDIVLTDGTPSTPMSYFDRLHRWIRGDIQALAFAKNRVRDGNGELVKNPINKLSKYKLFDNLRRILVPITAVIAMMLSVGYDDYRAETVFIIAISYLFFKVLVSLFTASQNISRRFFSFVIPSLWHTISNFAYEISSLFHMAFISSGAVIRSLTRMLLTRKHMLQWVTAAENDVKKLAPFPYYFLRMFPSVAVGVLLFLYSPHGCYKLLGLAWIALPFASFLLTKRRVFKKEIQASQKVTISEYACDLWNFYNDFVTEEDNYLPPDNYQIQPCDKVAHRTSPSNIGLYMLSVLAARDFKFITTDQMVRKLFSTVETLKKMRKWKGHLYNWYDTKSLEVIGGGFVSTVDSGNFIACMTALIEGLKEYMYEEIRIAELIIDIKHIIENANFKDLYNESRDLLYIGYDGSKEKFIDNCYDIFMTECRITSYLAIAKGQLPGEHWARLGRMLISKDGYMGLLSWNGTAFEFFMSPLLLPIYENSLEYEALNFAFKLQNEVRYKRVWGKSESCYYAFDEENNYKYKAFGVQSLGIERCLDKEKVVSPYSSFLTLCVAPNSSLRNLARLQRMGVYGQYGFYEAIDFTPQRVNDEAKIIKSYMAHHVGMSIIAAGNAVFNNIFCRRFMGNPQMASASELLQEKIPTNPRISKQNLINSDGKRKEIMESFRF